MVRALASHQCGPGSIRDPGVMCGLSLLLVLALALRVFLRVSSAPSTKTRISKFDLESVDEKPLCGDATAKFQFILFYFYYVSF